MTRRTLAALVVAVLAFVLYDATLLPGVDFGDTPSFQVMAGSPTISPRDAYPLYFALGDAVVWVRGGDKAHALNLASAIEAAIACGLVVIVSAALSESLVAAFAAALLFAASYTFWSQAIIAEVYALHILLVCLTLIAILAWQRRPSERRLAVFFAAYAISFGNHLAMILLLPAFTAFLCLEATGGWRSLIRPRIIAIAAGCVILGAAPYLWNLRDLWLTYAPPATLTGGLAKFWFDVTKADWRDTMVLQVPESMARERLRMYGFDVLQQFGPVVPIAAGFGIVALLRRSRAQALLVAGSYLVTLIFALSYNVGDSHVFFLSSHLFIVLLAACGAAWIGTMLARIARSPQVTHAAALGLLVLAGVRIYRDYPALDRSHDDRPAQRLRDLTAGVNDQHEIFLVDLNWQVQNGLNYYLKNMTTDVAATQLVEVLPHVPQLVQDNEKIGRTVLASARVAAALATTDRRFDVVIDSRTRLETLTDQASSLPPGTRYVLCVLRPTRDTSLDTTDLRAAVRELTGGALNEVSSSGYTAIAGLSGQPPQVARMSDSPFRIDISLDIVPVTIRMDAWLDFDTIRRMGFGHVIAARQHTLILERGVSFVAFDEQGRPVRRAYAGGIFAPEPRYRIVRAMVEP